MVEEPDGVVRVVGAALLHDGRLLAARRTAPPEARGRWELPGGKVELGERVEEAVVREIREELGCTVRVERLLGPAVAVRPGVHLEVAVVSLVDGEPVPHEHDALRWLTADRLEDIAWLDADRPFLPALRALLPPPGPAPLRAVLDDEPAARAVAGRLLADGFVAHVERERLAGEDDDEDHPWAVVTDAPQVVLEVLVEQYDGWVDAGPPGGGTSPSPLNLPSAPRR